MVIYRLFVKRFVNIFVKKFSHSEMWSSQLHWSTIYCTVAKVSANSVHVFPEQTEEEYHLTFSEFSKR